MYFYGENEFIVKCMPILDNIGIALIGYLGFIVTGLAILTGAVSSKVVKRLEDRNKIKSLEIILLSFYLIALVDAFVILGILFVHFVVEIPIDSIWLVNIILMSIFVYLIVFIIFYSVKLIGNCIELFYIINGISLIQEKNVDYKVKYNGYRLMALEKLILSDTSLEKVYEYRNILEDLVNEDQTISKEKEIYFEMIERQFGK